MRSNQRGETKLEIKDNIIKTIKKENEIFFRLINFGVTVIKILRIQKNFFLASLTMSVASPHPFWGRGA